MVALRGESAKKTVFQLPSHLMKPYFLQLFYLFLNLFVIYLHIVAESYYDGQQSLYTLL